MWKKCLLLASLACLTGCPSISTTGSARTLQRGHVQGFVNPGVYGAYSASVRDGVVAVPQIEGGIRVGVSDRVELGAKAWLLGLALNGKFALLRPESSESGFNLSLAPQVGYFGLSFNSTTNQSFHAINAVLPLLMGWRFGGGHEFTLGPKLADTYYIVPGAGSANVVWAGSSLGLMVRIAPNFRILPEVSFLTPVYGVSSGASYSTVSGASSNFLFQAGVAFLFGSEESPRPRPPPAPSYEAPPPSPVDSSPAETPAAAPSESLTPPPPPPTSDGV